MIIKNHICVGCGDDVHPSEVVTVEVDEHYCWSCWDDIASTDQENS